MMLITKNLIGKLVTPRKGFLEMAILTRRGRKYLKCEKKSNEEEELHLVSREEIRLKGGFRPRPHLSSSFISGACGNHKFRKKARRDLTITSTISQMPFLEP